MKKHEFLRELENSLKEKLEEADLREILSDYNDIFEDGFSENRDEDEISEDIGSPAAIAKAIVDDSVSNTGRNHTIPIGPDISNLAPMSKRLLAYLIDTALIAVVFLMIVIAIRFGKTDHLANSAGRVRIYNPGLLTGLMESLMLILNLTILMGIGFSNIIVAFELWLFKGYTLGKWITKIKVIKRDNNKITFWDAFIRDFVLKFGVSVVTGGMLNMVSFIMGSATPDHKTVHDLVAKTKVINIKR